MGGQLNCWFQLNNDSPCAQPTLGLMKKDYFDSVMDACDDADDFSFGGFGGYGDTTRSTKDIGGDKSSRLKAAYEEYAVTV